MIDVLKSLAKESVPVTPNEIGSSLGFRTGHNRPGQTSHNGRVMGPAQHVISPLIALDKAGLVRFCRRSTDSMYGVERAKVFALLAIEQQLDGIGQQLAGIRFELSTQGM